MEKTKLKDDGSYFMHPKKIFYTNHELQPSITISKTQKIKLNNRNKKVYTKKCIFIEQKNKK